MFSVTEHYDKQKNYTREQRAQLKTHALRTYNNYVKRKLIEFYTKVPQSRVLDVAGGRGGDLQKWEQVPVGTVKHVTLLDISAVSVAEAQTRYASQRFGFTFETLVADMTNLNLLSLGEQYDVISCQFALHYACENELTLRRFMLGVANNLKVGGVFFGTVPIEAKVKAFVNNSICQITELTDTSYKFTLADAITECKEYIVPWRRLVAIAEELGLEVREWTPFSTSAPNQKTLTNEEAEVANLYATFCMRRI